jgi:hypothetical protein
MDWLSLVPYGLFGGLMGFLGTRLFIWAKTPKPVDRHELPRLRAEAIKIIEASDPNEFSREMDIPVISASKDVEVLRTFVKFGDIARFSLINALICGMRYKRVKIKPSELTIEHIALVHDFMSVENGILMSGTVKTPEDASRIGSKIRSIMYYAMQNMEHSQRILSIVRDRDITDLTQVKELLSVMNKSENPPLAEGWL